MSDQAANRPAHPGAGEDPETWLVIPAFNEEPVLAEVLGGLQRLPYNVVVVDDGSTDGTASVAARFDVALVRHACNLGQGAAVQTGIDYALARPDTRFVVTFDADGQHRAEDIPALLAPLRSGECDVALGSRFLPGGKALNIPGPKRLALALATLVTRLTTGMVLTDTHNGLRAFTAEAAAQLRITHNGMAHASEILSQIVALGLRYREVPVTVTYTDHSLRKGQPLMSSVDIVWETLRGRVK
jgi:glycosyltransferase involved in cell wall biosynthesis